MNGTIYILTFANGKQYVGQTIRTMSERMSGHRYLIKSITGQAIAKYGEPKVGILRSGVDNQADLDRMEVEAIIEHLSLHPNGYNLESGGRGKGQVSDLTRTRMSASAKGNASHLPHDGRSMRGRHHTDEAKAKMGPRGHTWSNSEETITKRRKTWSAKTPEQMSAIIDKRNATRAANRINV